VEANALVAVLGLARIERPWFRARGLDARTGALESKRREALLRLFPQQSLSSAEFGALLAPGTCGVVVAPVARAAAPAKIGRRSRPSAEKRTPVFRSVVGRSRLRQDTVNRPFRFSQSRPIRPMKVPIPDRRINVGTMGS